MEYEKEIAETRKWAERYNKTGGLPALDVGLKALALVESQQLEIEALKNLKCGKHGVQMVYGKNWMACGFCSADYEEKNTTLTELLAVSQKNVAMLQASSHHKAGLAQAENAQLKEKLETIKTSVTLAQGAFILALEDSTKTQRESLLRGIERLGTALEQLKKK